MSRKSLQHIALNTKSESQKPKANSIFKTAEDIDVHAVFLLRIWKND